MSCAELLLELRNLGARVWLEDDRLRVAAPQGALTNKIRRELKDRRSELLDWLKRQGSARPALVARVGQERLPLSYAQQRLWFLYQMEGAGAAYNIPLALRLEGELDVRALEQALSDVVERHEALRTVFPQEEGVPYQKVLAGEEAKPRLRIESVREEELSERLAEAASVGIELERELPLRVWLFRLEEGDGRSHVLMLVLHHIAGDGWSLHPLGRDLEEAYGARIKDRTPEWEPLPVQYGDYTLWQRELLGSERDAESVISRQINFWKKALEGMPEELMLPADRVRPAVMSYRGGTVGLEVDAELHRGLLALSRRSGASLFMVLQAGVGALLSRLGAGEDIPIGTVVAGRSEAELEELVGFFVNTLVLRTDVSGDPTFTELVDRVRRFALEAYSHQEVPFERLVEAVQPERSQSRHPLFQVVLVLQNAPEAKLELPGLNISEQELAETIAKFDLTFSVNEQVSETGEAQGLRGYIEYSADLFDGATVEELGARLVRLLRAAVAAPEARLHELEIVTEGERWQLLNEFNLKAEQPVAAAATTTLVELFEAQVERTPEKVALSFGQQRLSYAELNSQANRVAHYLMAKGIGRESLVGIALERTSEMVVAIIGVLKTGGAYVPLDPEYPKARLEHMLGDARPAVVITSMKLGEELRLNAEIEFVLLDGKEVESALGRVGDNNPGREVSPEDAAYVIYTSGSTGEPKGVIVTQGNVTRLFAATERWFHFGVEDVWTLFHSYAFDFSVWEMWGALLYGGRLVVVPKAITRSPREFLQLLVEEGVTVLNQTPSAFYQLMQAEEEAEEEDVELGQRLKLRSVIFGGEALELRRLRGWYERHGESGPELVNMYGITETTVHVSYVRLTAEMVKGSRGSVIGGNIGDLRIYVLDPYLEPVAAGVVGELYVAGAGLARGYLKRRGLTAERFIADPYAMEPGERMYRTGDLGRWTREGVLEHWGRADQQVKIRGFRIELGEIEAALRREGGVRQAAVMVREDHAGGKQLVAYVVPTAGGGVELDTSGLRRGVKERLPEYMVPSAFVVMEQLPLTANGKLDRKALPEPQPTGETYIAPRMPEEEVLCAVFADVLGAERVGIGDNFFNLGGHSLLAAKLVSRVRAALGKEVSIRELFESPTVAELAERLSEERLAHHRRPLLKAGMDRQERLPLSYAQQRLWFLYQMEGAGAAYNIPLALRLEGELNVRALEQALCDVVERHEALRTVFPQEEGVPYQKVLEGEEARPQLRIESVREEELSGRLAEAAGVGIELERELPLRVWLFRLEEDERSYVLMLVLHHIAGDGWSLHPLGRDLEEAYGARIKDETPEWEPLPVQYGDYTLWQRELLGSERDAESVISRQINFWKKALEGMPEELMLPADRVRPAVMSYRGGTVGLEVDAELHRGLLALSRRSGASLFMVLQAGLAALLSRLGAGEDIPIGTVVAGRSEAELEELVGFFVNTLVLRTDVSGDPTFTELVERVRRFALEAYSHQEVPFERLVEAVQPERSQSRHPLFQVVLVLQNAPEAKLELPGLNISEQELAETIAKFDLTFSVNEQVSETGEAQGLRGYIEYSADLFDGATVEELGARLVRLLRAAVAAPEARLHELEIVTEGERWQLLNEFNLKAEQPVAAAATTTLVELFEAQVERTPEKVALSFGQQRLSYAELNSQANRVAHYLMGKGIGRESLVGIALERTSEMVVAIIGVLKTGGAYVPLDPEYPKARLEQMLADARPAVVITSMKLGEELRLNAEIEFVLLDGKEVESALGRVGDNNPGREVSPEDAAYVIYTSGSTGEPKGVIVTQGNVTRLFAATERWFHFGVEDVWTLFHSYAFDFSVWEMWGALLYGGRLVVVPKAITRSPREFLQLLVEEGVTVLNQTPSAFYQLMQAEEEAEEEDVELGQRLKLRSVIFGGEALELRRLRGWYERHGESGPELVNMYGITETTVHVSYVRLTAEMVKGSRGSVIGGNIGDLRIYVLDPYLEPVAAGVVGELYVAGAGLARGYLKRRGLTAERFIADAYAMEPGERMYRTGDLGRWTREGVLEHWGRADQQVKIRGFRIELGEIEAALRREGGVRQAAVMVREDHAGGKQLVAYVVPTAGGGVELDTSGLRRGVKERLPEYMVPSAFVVMEQLPLTANGKLDRKALPEPQPTGETYIAPRTPEEEVLCAVFADVLGAERVGIGDNFFELGGHSLLAAKLVSRVRAVLGKEVSIRELFESPTVAELAERLSEERLAQHRRPLLKGRMERQERAGGARLPLSYAQQRLWFLYQMEGAGAAYNIPLALRLEGELDVKALEQALCDVVERHEALRTVFPQEEGVPYQKVLAGEEAKPQLRIESVREEELSGRLAEAAGVGMELEQELPLRAWLFRLEEGDGCSHVLMLVLHHIAGDGWSLHPLGRDLEEAYGARIKDETPEWEALPVQYGDYTLWQRELLGSERDRESVISRQINFWKKALEGMPEELMLPADRVRPAVMSYRGGTVGLEVDAELHRGLLALSRRSGASLFMVLQAGLAALLSRLGAGEDIPIGTVVAGRSEAELEELVGFFVNTLVLRTDVSGDPTFTELVERVRRFALEAYSHQEVPFERLVEAVQPERSQSRHPLFQVALTLQNIPAASLKLPLLSTQLEVPEFNVAKFDLAFGFRELLSPSGVPLGMQAEVSYSNDLFDEVTAGSLATRFVRMLKEMVHAPDTRLHHAKILSLEEKHILLETFNATAQEVPEATVGEMFEEQAARTPKATAVVQGERSLNYQELNQQSNRLAHYLIARGIGPESLVGIALERSPEMVVAILAAWKSGAAYLPLDPEYPAARLEHMLADARPRVVLTAAKLQEKLPQNLVTEFICIDAANIHTELMLSPEHNPVQAQRTMPLLPQHAAYLIYTSGSTGVPKGVLVTHVGIPSLARSHVHNLNLTQRSRVLQFASLNFDASFWELAMALTTGAAFVLLKDERGGIPLQEILRSQRITHATLTPSVLSTLDERQESDIETLIVVGEQCPGELVARWSRARRMINAYGPTETTVCATMSLPLAGSVIPPIGFPVINTRVYVLDGSLEPVPMGVAGELYIAGKGLARGYLNRPALTAERFIADPNAGVPGARMYRTGDVVRRRNDGSLEFIGRTDQQVKLRGFRIELGEIETALRSLPDVSDAAVVVREEVPRGKKIIAYVVLGSQSIDPAILRSKLNERLPAHMLPEVIVAIDVLPLTASGKIDRSSLSKRPIEERKLESQASPQTRFEKKIAGIWKEVLGRASVGIHDNFFDLGGHSLLLAQVHAKLQKLLHARLPMVKLFEHPTVAALAAYLETDERHSASANGAKRKAGDANNRRVTDIAIIGMACRFPGAPSVSHFWDNLTHGIGSITALPDEDLSRLPQEIVNDPSFVNATGRLENIDLFDAAFFNLNPAEATATDPQQRLMLECAWETLESAGYNPRGQNVGVFAGAGESLYRDLLRGDVGLLRSLGELQLTISTGKDHIAPRLSYLLDLRGPSVPVNTACSTSLVAVHLACQSLMNGECEMALAGGVSLSSQTGYLFEENGILSPDGLCRAFDENARGTVPGSGVAVVLLKPLDQAVTDGDHIHAVIKGSAINNDGNLKVGYTAPSIDGQRRVIEQALANAHIAPLQISYIETHGTGTPLGDPIEIEALRQVFENAEESVATGEKLCALGSVKTNIGHCDSAAGIAGLIKAALCLEHRTLVPSLHFEKPNPQLDLDRSQFYVNTETMAWKQTPRLAGVSSFGIGGTNAHVILAEAPSSKAAGRSRPWQVLTLSARSESALERRRADLANALREKPDFHLADIAFTLNAGRRGFAFRQSFVCANAEDAITALTNSREKPVHAIAQERPVVFLFPGQGKAYTDLGYDLYRDEPRFREEVDRCCSRLVPLIGADLRDLMFGQEGMDGSIYRPLFWQTALFTVEYAMAQLWMSWGIKPAAMIGHSLGEYVAATLAGVLELDDALLLVTERARRTEDLEEGAMLAVPAREDEIYPYIKDIKGGISLAAVNGPELCILAGPTSEIESLYQQIAFLNPIRLDASHAFHSRLVEPLMEPLTRIASRMKLSRPQIPYFSNVTGSWMSDQDATDPGYWARHVRSTVRFNDSLQEALKKPNSVLLEVGPGKVLSELARRTYPETATFASMAGEPCGRALAQTVGRLWCEGIAIDWHKYYETEDRRRVPLPTYPFERQRYWVTTQEGSEVTVSGDPLALKDSPEKWLYATNWKRTNPLPRPELANDSFAGSWLVFSEADGVGEELASRLRQHGQTVREVRRGTAFQQNGADSFTLGAGTPEDYQRLLQSLDDNFPQRIIYAWDLSHDAELSPTAGFDSLIYLAQAVASSEKAASVRLSLISSGLHRVLDEELGLDREAAKLGIIHVLPKEAPAIKCQNIDLDEKQMASGRLAEQVLAEFASETPDTIVAYRHGHRWLPIVEQTPLVSGGGHQFQRGGVYVITHALQEIGFALAQHLVREFKCKVVLLARSFFPRPQEWDQWVREQGDSDPISRSIARLRGIGESLTILSVDVSDSERLKRIKTQIERDMGAVQGVFHLDKAAKTGLILGKVTPPSGSLRNDLAELAALDQAFGNQLLVIFSSNLAESGGIGQVDQAARSAVIAHFAERRASIGQPTVALELGTRAWTETAEENPDSSSFLSQQLEEKRQRFGMTPNECIAALQRAFSLSLPDVIVSTRDFNALMEQQHLFTTDFFQQQIGDSASNNGNSNGASHGRPDVSTSYTAPRNEVETLLVELWQGTFRIQEIGVADNFFELGGHSLLAVQLLKNMNQTFSSKITLKDLFDGPTIAQLAAKISGTPADSDDAAELEALLAEIEGMSADDLRAELDGSKEGINTE